jgi:hypothetical protein
MLSKNDASMKAELGDFLALVYSSIWMNKGEYVTKRKNNNILIIL